MNHLVEEDEQFVRRRRVIRLKKKEKKMNLLDENCLEFTDHMVGAGQYVLRFLEIPINFRIVFDIVLFR